MPFPQRAPSVLREMSARRARLPPSPLLSARIRMRTYFSVTTIIIDQKMRLRTPKMWSWSTGRRKLWWPAKVSRKA